MANESSTFEIEVQVTVEVTTQDIDDIMSTALDSIGYWCSRAKVVGKRLGKYASDQISRGGTLLLFDAESDDKWELTRDKFLSGMRQYIEQYKGTADPADIDGEAADMIVQLGLFGEVVFG